MQCLTRKW